MKGFLERQKGEFLDQISVKNGSKVHFFRDFWVILALSLDRGMPQISENIEKRVKTGQKHEKNGSRIHFFDQFSKKPSKSGFCSLSPFFGRVLKRKQGLVSETFFL